MNKLLSVLIAFWACQLATAQIVIDSDSTRSTGVKTYLFNNGSYFRHPTDDTETGLVFPRDGGCGYVYAAGCWIGARFDGESDYRVTRVLKSYNPISGESMCVPGHYRDGNLFRPDLQELYAVKRHTSDSYEALLSTFHDGDLSAYPRRLDTSSWRQSGMPLGFQFNQRMIVWSTSELENTITVETSVRYTGERRLDSVYLCSVTDVAIGQSDNAMIADMGDYCVIEDKDQQDPFVIASSTMEGERRCGTLGIGLISSDPMRRHDGIQIIRSDMVDMGSPLETSYSLMSDGVRDDVLPAGDKVVLLSVHVGDVVKGDSFKITVGFVVASGGVQDPTIEIRNKLHRLRSQLTTIDRNPGLVQHSRIPSHIVQGNAFQLPDEFHALPSVMIVSTLAEKSVVEVRQGVVDVTGLPNGSYLMVDSNHHLQRQMKLLIMR